MPDKSWTLTVSYVNRVASITDPNGGNGTETIFVNETDQVTFQPGTGVQAVTAFVVNSPIPLPTGVTVTQSLQGTSCVVLDADTLASTAAEVDVDYCIQFTDSNGIRRSTDPQLINKPTVRPGMLTPMARRTSRSTVKAAALGKYSSKPANARGAAAPKGKPTAKPAGAKAKQRASK